LSLWTLAEANNTMNNVLSPNAWPIVEPNTTSTITNSFFEEIRRLNLYYYVSFHIIKTIDVLQHLRIIRQALLNSRDIFSFLSKIK
jgi:hypothetical protein